MTENLILAAFDEKEGLLAVSLPHFILLKGEIKKKTKQNKVNLIFWGFFFFGKIISRQKKYYTFVLRW